MNELEDDNLTVKEVANYLKCSEWLIRDLCKKKKIPYFMVGNMYRFRKNKLEEWIRKEENKNNKY